MKSNNGSTPANDTDEILLNKTPQQQPQTIPRVTHSPLAAPCWAGCDTEEGWWRCRVKLHYVIGDGFTQVILILIFSQAP